jgi:hypothetical protein
MENITMKRNNTTKNKQPKNVLRIADSPKFTNRKLIAAERVANPDEFINFTLGENTFGLAKGDSLICTTEFNPEEILEDSLVVFENESGYRITAAANIDNSSIFALIKFVQREL